VVDVPDPATQRTLAGRGARLAASLIAAGLFGALNLMPSLIGVGYIFCSLWDSTFGAC